eukprot:bmy_22200T0
MQVSLCNPWEATGCFQYLDKEGTQEKILKRSEPWHPFDYELNSSKHPDKRLFIQLGKKDMELPRSYENSTVSVFSGRGQRTEGRSSQYLTQNSMYLVAVVGNVTILAVVKLECSLHQLMYFFLCMLAVIDLVLSTSTMPKLLTIFWFGACHIDLDTCLTQMFFIHCFVTVESGIFLAMAFDHYVAICDPLCHTSMLTHAVVGRLGPAALLHGVLYIGPLPLMIRLRLPLYRTQIIAHSYCEYMAVVTLA